MKINNLNMPINYGKQAYINGANENKRIDSKIQNTDKSSDSVKKGDVVNLSGPSKEMKLAMETVKNDKQDVRFEKVNSLKQSIKEGKYEINPEKIAEKMIGSIFNQVA